jgi:hypothetical protein
MQTDKRTHKQMEWQGEIQTGRIRTFDISKGEADLFVFTIVSQFNTWPNKVALMNQVVLIKPDDPCATFALFTLPCVALLSANNQPKVEWTKQRIISNHHQRHSTHQRRMLPFNFQSTASFTASSTWGNLIKCHLVQWLRSLHVITMSRDRNPSLEQEISKHMTLTQRI